ncbi:hypothetical protein SDC9_102378 [bioreactor metagenome]|uniref:HTH cro/C1-type domain-containing protein n=1 Tax=bioreactor metagenome TaxID=1076179 RepID=A0A645ATE1_9ZZZZ|nr:helix-turn-helix transcriptional regulator [Oscillospiraceae bacterium]
MKERDEMTIKIGEKLKLLRKKNDITQDKLAEYLGVTAQAISRWESENCYPDIEILPSIASFFNITIDELLGYNASQKEQDDIIMNINKLEVEGRFDEALVEARRAIALYPQNYALAVMLASNLTMFNSAEDNPTIYEAIALCKRVLRDCTGGSDANDILRLCAKNILIMSLNKKENFDEALHVALTMPSIVMGREFICQMVLKGKSKIDFSLSVLPIIINMLNSCFLNGIAYPDEKIKPLFEYSSEECIRDISIWDAVYAAIDKNIGENEKKSCWVYMFLHQRLARKLLEEDNKSEAIKHFELAVKNMPYIDAEKLQYNFNLTQRSSTIKKDTLCKQDNYTGKSSAYVFLHGYVENGYYLGMEDEPTFKECLELLTNYAG